MLKLSYATWLLSFCCFSLLPLSLEAKQAPPNLIKVYKYQGSVQCQGGGQSLSQMLGQLRKAGVKVFKSSCGVDGLSYIAVCGAPDGKINIFSIAKNRLAKAQQLGFDLLENLADAQAVKCKP